MRDTRPHLGIRLRPPWMQHRHGSVPRSSYGLVRRSWDQCKPWIPQWVMGLTRPGQGSITRQGRQGAQRPLWLVRALQTKCQGLTFSWGLGHSAAALAQAPRLRAAWQGMVACRVVRPHGHMDALPAALLPWSHAKTVCYKQPSRRAVRREVPVGTCASRLRGGRSLATVCLCSRAPPVPPMCGIRLRPRPLIRGARRRQSG